MYSENVYHNLHLFHLSPTRDGPDWKRMRSLLDKQMLRPQSVSGFADKFGEVAVDFVERLRKLRDPAKKTVEKLDLELFYWSLECKASFCLFLINVL